MSTTRELRSTYILLAFSILACAMLGLELVTELAARVAAGHTAASFEQVVFMLAVGAVLYGNLVYHRVRVGYLERSAVHEATGSSDVGRLLAGPAPRVSILVPSYCEEPEVVRRTLVSAALLVYPGKHIVLLVDDPPAPANLPEAAAAVRVRALPAEIAAWLEKPARRVEELETLWQGRAARGVLQPHGAARELAELHAELAAWLDAQADYHPSEDHADRFLVQRVLRRSALEIRGAGASLERGLVDGEAPALDDIHARLRGLAARFGARFEVFERKRYSNLSHAPNKAMNLNTYIGLMGLRHRSVERADGVHLEPHPEGSFEAPDADFVLTLDADSVLAPEYALELVELLSRPGHEHWAVAQTPYSAFPEPPGELERVAGATTDIQYLVHQGFTYDEGTFWVGANAVLRKRALEGLRVDRMERGHVVPEFIRDRTVIEDTESSVELAALGWRLYNHPRRLAWSATPPDFGALAVQRKRWANGGLLILPKLLRHLRGSGTGRFRQAFVRCHYLTSIALVNCALLLLLFHPFEEGMRSFWLPAAAVSYFGLYTRDLMREGYRASDVVRVYGLNLLLVPVNLAGVLDSLRQAVTGRKTPFARTPKVEGRTAVHASILLALVALLVACLWRLALDLEAGLVFHATFVGSNAGLLILAFARYIGFGPAWEDLQAQRPTPARAEVT